jgi:hypothetical protein
MRTLLNLNVPKNTAAKFPFHSLQNETDTQDGTPVVEEIYGDILTNIYKLLQSVGITPTGTQDSDTSQYQILQALKQLPNSLNDIEQILELTATTWSVGFNLSFLPNKYFFVARASENYVSGVTYSFKGSGATTLDFTSNGFKSGDEVLVIIDTDEVRAYSLGSSSRELESFSLFGSPLSFNDTNEMYYESNGNLITDFPSVNTLQEIIRTDLSNFDIEVKNIFIFKENVFCFCYESGANEYFFRNFPLNDLSESLALPIVDGAFNTTNFYNPYVYCDGNSFFVTNLLNDQINDYEISRLDFDSFINRLSVVSTITLSPSFVKTTNAAIKDGYLYTLVDGFLGQHEIATGTKADLGYFGGIVENIFSFDGFVYYQKGNLAKKWF